MRTLIKAIQTTTPAIIMPQIQNTITGECTGASRMVRIWRVSAILALLLVSSALCAEKGQVLRGEIDSSSLKANLLEDASIRPYSIYLPPSYDHTTNRYPVIYALHGYLDDDALLTTVNPEVPSAIPPFLDSMIATRQLGEVIVVFVSATNRLNGSFYLNSEVIGDYESYITVDLVNKIDGSYRTLATRESRGITGYSMGGWGAAHLALKFPNVFSVFVSEAGFYSSQSAWFDRISRQLGMVRPSTLAEFDALNFPSNAAQALFAGLLPNLQRPPLFTDYLYETVAGRLTTNIAAIKAASERDVQNGDLPRYVARPLRLTAIKVVHGTQDQVAPISETRNFTNALKIAGIPCSYEQHSGEHIYRADLALPFLVTNLVGAPKYIEPPRLTWVATGAGVVMQLSTQAGVNYRIEHTPSLDATRVQWAQFETVQGTGQAVQISIPHNTNNDFFRASATNAETQFSFGK